MDTQYIFIECMNKLHKTKEVDNNIGHKSQIILGYKEVRNFHGRENKDFFMKVVAFERPKRIPRVQYKKWDLSHSK